MEGLKTKRKMKKPNGFEKSEGNLKKAKKPDNDNDDDNDNDNEDEEDKDLLLKKEKEEKLQQRFIECLNSFNPNAISECLGYLDKLPFEVIESVLEKTSGIAFPNWNYAQKILDDYIERKIDTLEKVKADNFKSRDKPKQDFSKLEEY